MGLGFMRRFQGVRCGVRVQDCQWDTSTGSTQYKHEMHGSVSEMFAFVPLLEGLGYAMQRAWGCDRSAATP